MIRIFLLNNSTYKPLAADPFVDIQILAPSNIDLYGYDFEIFFFKQLETDHTQSIRYTKVSVARPSAGSIAKLTHCLSPRA